MTASYNFASLCDNPVLCKDDTGTKRAFPWVKQQEREVEQSPASNIKVKERLEPQLHSLVCLHGVYRNKLSLYVYVSGSGWKVLSYGMLPEVDSTEIPTYFNQITRHKIPKDTSIHNNRHEILKCHTGYKLHLYFSFCFRTSIKSNNYSDGWPDCTDECTVTTTSNKDWIGAVPYEVFPLLMTVLSQFNWNKQRFRTEGNAIKRLRALFR